MPKVVFISYSHRSREKLLNRFVQELATEVMVQLGDRDVEEVAFYDAKRMETGDYWRDKLADELVGCKACVAVCDRAFTLSPFCGKELRVFLDRVNAWKAGRGEGANARSPVFPVIWVAKHVPPALESFQNITGQFPPVYAEKGLRAMYKLGRRYSTPRTEIVMSLAEWIADAVRSVDLPPRSGIPPFDQIASLFDAHETPVRHGVALLPLLHQKMEARPYEGERTLADFADVAFGDLVPWRVLDDEGDLEARLRTAREGEEVTVVIIDLPTLTDSLYRNVLQRVDAELASPAVVAVLRAWAAGSDAQEQNAELTVRSAFAGAIGRGVLVHATSIRSASALEGYLSQTVLTLRTEMINRLQPMAVVDPDLVLAADQAGIPVHRHPTVVGPGGSAR